MRKSSPTLQEKQILPWKKKVKEEERTARARNIFRLIKERKNAANIYTYRKWNVSKLASVTERFSCLK